MELPRRWRRSRGSSFPATSAAPPGFRPAYGESSAAPLTTSDRKRSGGPRRPSPGLPARARGPVGGGRLDRRNRLGLGRGDIPLIVPVELAGDASEQLAVNRASAQTIAMAMMPAMKRSIWSWITRTGPETEVSAARISSRHRTQDRIERVRMKVLLGFYGARRARRLASTTLQRSPAIYQGRSPPITWRDSSCAG